MQKWMKYALWGVGVVVFLLILNFFGVFGFLNEPLNNLRGGPDYSCTQDSDCVMKLASCGVCQPYNAVNSKWDIWCPFVDKGFLLGTVNCKIGLTPDDVSVQCKNNICIATQKQPFS